MRATIPTTNRDRLWIADDTDSSMPQLFYAVFGNESGAILTTSALSDIYHSHANYDDGEDFRPSKIWAMTSQGPRRVGVTSKSSGWVRPSDGRDMGATNFVDVTLRWSVLADGRSTRQKATFTYTIRES